ncbi:hypothetical protein H8356DRAFT_1713574 [Neocallimastix lanati (nom. inval.)]|nr:hypothetical protein H8356DRAFT_1713574 [Neocallimastix sp. JGI-2020a]
MLVKKFNNIYKKLLLCFIFFGLFQFINCDNNDVNKDKSIDNINKRGKPKEIKVSIIMPTYNSAEFIERSLKCALNQTLKEIEIIVIDDHSTDNTLDILKKYEKDTRLKIISLNQNRGSGVARNLGLELAVGKFIGFIDSDDYVDERFFEFLYKYSKDVDVVIGIFVDSTNLSDKYSHHRKFKSYGANYDSIWSRDVINKNHIRYPTDGKIGEDVKFRKSFMATKPRTFNAPDEGIYYYYKRREGSQMNFKGDYIKKLSESNKEGVEKIENDENLKLLTKENHLIKYVTIIAVPLVGLTGVLTIAAYIYKKSRYIRLNEASELNSIIESIN